LDGKHGTWSLGEQANY